METIRLRLGNVEQRLGVLEDKVNGVPGSGVKGMEARFEEFFARDDERRLVEANHHQEVIEAQKAMRSSWNLRLAIIGVVLSLVLAILAWFTYQEAKTRMGSFLAPHRPGRSALTAPGFEASINPKEMP